MERSGVDDGGNEQLDQATEQLQSKFPLESRLAQGKQTVGDEGTARIRQGIFFHSVTVGLKYK